MYFTANQLLIALSLFFSGLLCTNCRKESSTVISQPPDIYLDFERALEPFQRIPVRPIDPQAENNGCIDPVAWNQYYDFNVCIASTCDMSDYAIERSDAFARLGSHSLRFFLRPTSLDKWPRGEASHRAELGPRINAPVTRYPRVGEERWYGMSVFFPEDFVFAPRDLESEIRFSIAQWQHGTTGSPALALEVYGDKLMLARSSGNSMDTEWNDPMFLTRIERGKWIDVILQVKWEKENGMAKIWVDEQLKLEQEGIATIYENLEVGGAFKIGLYYWRWKDRDSVRKTLDAGINDREIYIDEVREFIGEDGFSAVDAGDR